MSLMNQGLPKWKGKNMENVQKLGESTGNKIRVLGPAMTQYNIIDE